MRCVCVCVRVCRCFVCVLVCARVLVCAHECANAHTSPAPNRAAANGTQVCALKNATFRKIVAAQSYTRNVFNVREGRWREVLCANTAACGAYMHMHIHVHICNYANVAFVNMHMHMSAHVHLNICVTCRRYGPDLHVYIFIHRWCGTTPTSYSRRATAGSRRASPLPPGLSAIRV